MNTVYDTNNRALLSGNEAVALGALHGRVRYGSGYPGTPSTEILETFAALGGNASWAPNEKVALETGIGAAFAGARTLVTMKHVGLNVAADPFFSAAYTGVDGALVIVCADDPGMASSQNEQDSRRHAVAAGVPVIEPSDSQEAYDFTREALRLSEEWAMPVMVRLTTRICHSRSIVIPREPAEDTQTPHFERNIAGRVMIPGHARPAHRRLREKLARITAWNEKSPLNIRHGSGNALGIITSGISFQHAAEAAPEAAIFKLALVHPLPLEQLRRFRKEHARCLVIEEGDPVLEEALLAAGIDIERRPESFRFGELDVVRVRDRIAGMPEKDKTIPPGRPPQLCAGCPHRFTFAILRKLDCIVSGDIGCYTLGALAPYRAMDSQLCMGASIGIGLGLRRTLPEEEAKRVVSVIGDSTFFHSGLTGIAEMVYNPPAAGHVVLILDNGTTAMTGMQDHPGTGRTLRGERPPVIYPEKVVEAMGVEDVVVLEKPGELEAALRRALDSEKLSVIVVRRPCKLLERKLEKGRKVREAAHV
jgi:indolepyruvate ferredoxin oxidoreductase, alpha subunit